MFEEFKQEVFAAYKDLSSRHELPDEMENLTRFGLKRHAQRVLADRYDRKDDEVIRQFFDPRNQYANNEERIDRFDLDGFRPLVLFMQGRTQNPHERVVKILAWLIDFEPRPYAEWRKMRGSDLQIMNDSGADTAEDLTANSSEIGGKPQKKNKLAWYLAGVALLAGLAAYFAINQPQCLDKQCMYWASDRYVAICCEERLPGANIVAIRPYELEHFRRITQPDTLTVQHANKVWYSKIDNTVEFFTAPATQHPVHQDRLLKPATAYILEKYAGK